MIWSSDSEGKITSCNQVRAEWPDKVIELFGTEITPGSYNFFAKAIVHEDKIRKDISTSEDDEFIFNVVSKIKSSLGFIG